MVAAIEELRAIDPNSPALRWLEAAVREGGDLLPLVKPPSTPDKPAAQADEVDS